MSLLLFSGGCDSTYLLHKMIEDQDYPRPIRTISINHPQIHNNKQQAAARTKILNKLNHSCHLEVTIEHKGAFDASSYGGLTQPVIWLLHALTYLDRDEHLYAGYIRGDDVWHYKHHIMTAFEHFQKIRNGNGQIILPLEWTTKKHIIKELKTLKLFNLTWTCEGGLNRQCKKCKPCLSLRGR